MSEERKRELTSHKVNGLNDALDIAVLDEPGPGNACRRYVVYHPNDAYNQDLNAAVRCEVIFQNGPILEAGVNGVSNEALLAIVEDRLRGFQSGPYSCRENSLALTQLQEAIHWLHHRTRERVARNVEGTMTV